MLACCRWLHATPGNFLLTYRQADTRMKLVFPGGEHPQVLLGPGVNRVGSDPDGTIVLDQPGVLPRHCELHVNDHGVVLQVPKGTKVRVNGREVDGVISLRSGDSVNFDCILARLTTLDTGSPGPGNPDRLTAANDDPGATAIRQALPRYVLRGMSGESLGRSYPVHGSTLVGRGSKCDLRLHESGLSREHARLLPAAEGIQLQDLGSTNGSFINGRRLQQGLARVGDEIGFDVLRFRLAVPGQAFDEVPDTQPVPTRRRVRTWAWLVVGIGALGALAIWAATVAR